MRPPVYFLRVCGAGFILLLIVLISHAADKTKTCTQCQGAGKIPCNAAGCTNGQTDCTGNCLRLNKGVWEHMEVKGHAGIRVWQKFNKAGGGWNAWNDHHLGEVVEYQNGNPVLVGKCKVCDGTTKIPCATCKGTGEITCPLCKGTKVMADMPSPPAAPAAAPVTATAAPKAAASVSTRFELKDGRVLVGRKAMIIGNSVTLRTEKGNVEVDRRDIVKEEKLPEK